jgi:predicted PurR-regulated permease PerM
MNNIVKSKSLVSLILSIVILITSAALSATTPTITEHKQIINQFISEISLIQQQVFDIAQFAQVNPSEFNLRLSNNISTINSNIEKLNNRILEYLETVPEVGDQNIHVLLISNALNFIKNGLYSLRVLTNTTPTVLRIKLLDEYFRSRIAGLDTLNTVENLLLQYIP